MNTVKRLKIAEQNLLDSLRNRNLNYEILPNRNETTQLLSDVTETAKYSALQDALLVKCRTINQSLGAEGYKALAKLLMVHAMLNWCESDFSYPKSGYINKVYEREIGRLLANIEDDKKGYEFDPNTDVYIKDLQCFTGRMVACGAQVVDLHSGIPRKLLFTDGLPNIARNLSFLLRVGGFSPLCEIHTHTPTLGDFKSEGWDDCYHCLAEIFEADSSIKGMIGSSWFYDPALENISPNLGYLRHRPLENGARLFRVGPLAASKRDALATSKTRNRLYEEGSYTPTHYALVWSRNDLLKWSKNFRH